MQSSANQPGELCIYTITSVRIDSIFAPLRQTPCTAGRKDKLRLLPLDRRCNSLLSIATLFLSLSQSRVHTHTLLLPIDSPPQRTENETRLFLGSVVGSVGSGLLVIDQLLSLICQPAG